MSAASGMLQSYVRRIENLQEEIDERNKDKRDLYAEAKHSGFDVKALKEIIKLRKQDPGERDEHETIVHTYMVALGMVVTEGPSPAPAHEAREAHDESTGEIIGEW